MHSSLTNTHKLYGKIVLEFHTTQHLIHVIAEFNSYSSFIHQKGKSYKKPNEIKDFHLPNHAIYTIL